MRRPTLVRRGNSKLFSVRFEVPTGVDECGRQTVKMVMRSTGAKTKSEAWRRADEIYRQAMAEAGHLEDDAARDAMAILRRATEATARGELSEPAARGWIAQLYEIAHGKSLPMYSTRDWMSKWIERKAMTVSEGSLTRYNRSVADFCASIGDKSEGRLELVTVDDVRRFQSDMRKQCKTAKTANHRLADISAAFAAAMADGLILANPCLAVKSLPERDSRTRDPFTDRELAAMFERLPDEWRTLVAIGLYTGGRVYDCATLRWSAIDLEHDALTIEVRKTGDVLKVPIPEPLKNALLAIDAPDDPTAFVLPTIGKLPRTGPRSASVLFGKQLDTIGINRGTVDDEGNKCRPRVSFHSLRHNFVSLLASANVPQELRKELAGHRTDSSHKVYTHDQFERLRDAVAKLPEYGK